MTNCDCDCNALQRDLNQARARLAEVEAERDLAAEDARRAYIDTANMAGRLAAVLALCGRAKDAGSWLIQVGAVRAAARGEDDRD